MEVEKKRNISEIIWIIQPTWMKKFLLQKKIDEMNFLEREEKKGESLSTENDFFKNYKKLVTATKIFLTRHNSVVHYWNNDQQCLA